MRVHHSRSETYFTVQKMAKVAKHLKCNIMTTTYTPKFFYSIQHPLVIFLCSIKASADLT